MALALDGHLQALTSGLQWIRHSLPLVSGQSRLLRVDPLFTCNYKGPSRK